MDVIGAGFGRTGTSSLKAALETLGFGPCYHMTEVFKNPPHSKLWLAAAHAEKVEWENLLEGYNSAVDWPVCSFYRELAETYPQAKVILTVRDPDAWHESVLRTIYAVSTPGPDSFLPRLVGLFSPHMRRVRRMTKDLIWSKTFHANFEDREYATGVFNLHNEEVKRTFPPERLLVYDVREGWPPLCDFLGVEAPLEPFPRLNDSKTFRRIVLASRAANLALPAFLALVALAAARLLRRRT